MIDRGMKKWRPFNAVTSREELLKRPDNYEFPNLSEEEIASFEEILTKSMYTSLKVRITYIENGSKKSTEDYVERIDEIKKDVILKSKKINFRQIYKVEYAKK